MASGNRRKKIKESAQIEGVTTAADLPKPEEPKPENGHAARVRKLPSKLGIKAGDLEVQLIDKGDNAAGIGIRVVPHNRQLSKEEKDVIREIVKAPSADGRPSGFDWEPGIGMWLKEIGADAPGAKAVAIRLDAERRVERLAEALADHQRDPAGFAEREKQRREQAAERERIPD